MDRRGFVTWKIAPDPAWIMGFGASSLSVALTVTMRTGAGHWRRIEGTTGAVSVMVLSMRPCGVEIPLCAIWRCALGAGRGWFRKLSHLGTADPGGSY